MSNRSGITMDEGEIAQFLDGPRTLNVATLNADGTIHLVPMWFVMHGHCPVFTTYRKSQKVVNLRRTDVMTGLVEAGDDYAHLQGVQLIGRGRILEDQDDVRTVVAEASAKYGMPAGAEQVARTASKRVAIALEPHRVVSWDHSRQTAPGHA